MTRRLALAFALCALTVAHAETRLNSFVVELLNVAQPTGEHHVTVPFSTWLYVRLDGPGKVDLGGQNVLSDAGETMRWVAQGDHTLKLSGQPDRLVVRRIPEVFCYLLEYQTGKTGPASYVHSRDFLDQFLLPNCNTVYSQNQDAYAEDAAAWHAHGGKWICNQGMNALRDPKVDLAAYWRGILEKPMFDAVIHDEVLSQDPPYYKRWAEELPKALTGLPGKQVYLWTPWGVLADPDWTNYVALDREQPADGQLCLRCGASPDKVRTFRQVNLELEAGGTYTLSCRMKVKDLTAQDVPGNDGYDGAYSGIFLIDTGWYSTCGSMLKADQATGEWQTYHRTFKPPKSRDGKYHLIVCPPARGTMWLDDLRLEAGDQVGGGTNLLTNGGFEADWDGWASPAQFDVLRKLIQDNDCRINIEAYQHELADEATARRAIGQRLVAGMAGLRKGAPGFERNIVLSFSAGNSPLRYSNDHHPDVCYKTHLDLQFNLAANSEAFRDLGGIGFWTMHYMDEEATRWYGKLFRHYLLEGKTDPLAPWPYQLDYLSNPGFEQGLDGWTTMGDVKVQPWRGALKGIQRGSYAQVPEGKQALVTSNPNGQPTAFTQQLKHLQPGQLYALKFYVTNPECKRRDLPVDIELKGVVARPEHDEHHVWVAGDNKQYWNYYRRVFKAEVQTATLTLGDPGTSGAPLIFDFIEVEPYDAP